MSARELMEFIKANEDNIWLGEEIIVSYPDSTCRDGRDSSTTIEADVENSRLHLRVYV